MTGPVARPRSLAPLPALLALVLLGTAHDARAEPVLGPPPPPAASAYPPVRWDEHWPRFSVAEVALSVGVTIANDQLGEALSGPDHATIRFEVPLLDHGFRDLLKGSTQSRRDAAARMSDIGFRTLVFVPYVLDVGLGALVLHHNPDVAAQLAMLDFEILTLAGMTQLLGSRLLGRARPYVDSCPPEGCSGGPYRSFLSGHEMASFTAAGLVCVHHKFIPLFGGGLPDSAACAWAITAASMVGVLRLVADQHWASDVLVGAGMGWLFGYYLPQLLHFRVQAGREPATDGGHRGFYFPWLPLVSATPHGAQAGLAIAF